MRWIVAVAVLGLIFGFLAGRAEVLRCLDAVQEGDPRPPVEICRALPTTWRDALGYYNN